MRATLEQVEKTTGKRPKDLDGPECPLEMEYLWYDFLTLSRGRTSNGFGANPLTWADVWAWLTVTRQTLTPWEVDTLIALDNAWMSDHAKAMDTKSKPKPATHPPKKRR